MTTAPDAPAHVAVLVYMGVAELDLGGMLGGVYHLAGEGRAFTVARSRMSLVGAGGLVTTPQRIFAALEPPAAVLIPGGALAGAQKAARDPLVRAFLTAQVERGIPVAAVGAGVLLLADAALLTDREVGCSADLADTVWGANPSGVRVNAVVTDGHITTAPGGLGALRATFAALRGTYPDADVDAAAARLGLETPAPA
ncbi:DJ-1/PfpI family protein [Deinococcus maricopensis]|uniref:ThiJ/PfpI domain-containing protein n=1 Tax=Deinococcus maricopensis (strain DSM 21211 / LMG 22137 / NRRL B-23946 / LB-34) TaxID=709986 RepID=E8U7A2_DEIML|nr:DJ-1/PfpI family protein [Deinococcus maricopensis]ADV66941.1 ThiJ/PfpI domain-containing protein [Deinococcus maricopensis DSM 21211]